MEMFKNLRSMITLVAAVLAAMTSVLPTSSGQITTGCTNALITSFTPCLNYITGSSNGGSSPTADCCKAVGGLLSTSTECTCLILTGNVPFSLPINRTLAISLPRMCKSASVPLFQCKGSATPLPPPGTPVTFGPSLPPLPPLAPPSGSSSSVLPPFQSTLSPAPTPEVSNTPVTDGLKPLLLPSAALKRSNIFRPSLALLLVGIMLLNNF